MTLRVAVVGLGQMGILHAAVTNALPGYSIVAICDKDSRLTRLVASAIPSIKFYAEISEMCDEEKPDVIYVCTPTFSHFELLMELSEYRPKGVFVEKPLGMNYSESEQIVSAYQGLQTVTMVGFQKRFNGVFSKARELVQGGALGRLLFFRAHHFISDNYGGGSNWKFKRGTGGVTLEFAPHILDMVQWFFGEPTKVTSETRSLFSAEVDDYMHVALEYDSGLIGQVDACWSMRNYTPGEFMVEVHGETGMLSANEDRLVIDTQGNGEASTHGVEMIPAASLTPPLPFLVASPENVLQDVHFLSRTVTGTPSLTSFADACKVNKLIERILGGAGNV